MPGAALNDADIVVVLFSKYERHQKYRLFAVPLAVEDQPIHMVGNKLEMQWQEIASSPQSQG